MVPGVQKSKWEVAKVVSLSKMAENLPSVSIPLKCAHVTLNGRAKRKGVFEHAQNAHIQINHTHAQSIIQAFSLY